MTSTYSAENVDQFQGNVPKIYQQKTNKECFMMDVEFNSESFVIKKVFLSSVDKLKAAGIELKRVHVGHDEREKERSPKCAFKKSH